MSIISPADLEASPLADLHALASALGIDGFRRLRKDDLIDAILARQGATATPKRSRSGTRRGAAGDGADEAESPAEDEEPEADERPARSSRSRRPREEETAEADERPARSSRSRRPREEETAEADERPARSSRSRSPREEEETEEADERPARSGRSRRRRGGRGRDAEEGPREGAGTPARREESEPAVERIAEGVVELLANGSGFLRVSESEVSDDDVYISAAQARRCELVAGDRISGPVRAARRSERHPSLIRVDTINGVPADEAVIGTRVEEIDVDFPNEQFTFTDAALAALPSFGRGSRVLIFGAPRSGRTALLARIAAALAASEGLDVELLAVGVRPEELTEYKEIEHATSTGLSFAASAEAQESAVEQAAERGRRIALRGGNAVLLIDTLDGLGHGAMRRAIAAARNLRGAGSLTVIATARAPIGGETTVISLLPTGEFPAIDESASGTLRPELLVAAKPTRVRKPRAPRASTAKPKAAPAEAEVSEPTEPTAEPTPGADTFDPGGDLDL
jgi:transcription termination factor Rho